MRKEVLLAIFAGTLFGLVVAFGVWRANLAIRQSEDSKISSIESPDNSQKTTYENGLTISKPENFDVATENPITVEGITKENTWVVVSGEVDDSIIKTKDGSFKAEVELSAGVNSILVKAINEDGDTAEKILTLVYSTQFLEQAGLIQ